MQGPPGLYAPMPMWAPPAGAPIPIPPLLQPGADDDYEDASQFDQSWDEESNSPDQAVASTSTKRPAPGKASGSASKKAKLDEDGAPAKAKTARGARACLRCRRLKMRCMPDDGPDAPCRRCKTSNDECIYETSMRGRRRNQKADALAKSVKAMESTLQTVLESISTSNPAFLAAAAGMISGQASAPSPQPPIAGPSTIPTPPMPMAMPAPQMGAMMPPGWTTMRPHPPSRPPSRPASPRLHSLPVHGSLNPLGLLAEASLQSTRPRKVVTAQAAAELADVEGADRPRPIGLANQGYFKPGSISFLPLRKLVIEQRIPPAILTDEIVSVDEVVDLFQIYFQHCYRHISLLVEDFHTPTAVAARSPFLFTTICAIAARYYDKRPGLYAQIMPMARKLAFERLCDGYKSVEIVQGFLLLSVWSQPAERYEEEQAWMMAGIAIRMAYDLNLHRRSQISLPPTFDEATRTQAQREMLNRERTWLYSFTVDHSIAIQSGKPFVIREDEIIRSCGDWWKQPSCVATDRGLMAMVDLHRRITRMMDTLSAVFEGRGGTFPAHTDVGMLMRVCSDQLDDWVACWNMPYDQSSPCEVYVEAMGVLYVSYYKLIPFSFGLQHALANPAARADLPNFSLICYECASSVVGVVCDVLGPRGFLRYATDPILVFAAYAGLFLLKSAYADEERVLAQVSRLADTLSSAAVDPQHTPALYGSFLRAVIEARKEAAARSRAATREGSPVNGATANDAAGPSGAMPVDPILVNSIEPDVPMPANNAESMLTSESFWDSMLLPGFPGAMGGLSASGGHFTFDEAPWGNTGFSSVIHSAGPASPAPTPSLDPSHVGQFNLSS